MTVDEIARKWEVKPITVLDYIYHGYIPNLAIENNCLVLPDLPKLHILHGKAKTSSSIYRTILVVCNRCEYINANIFGITEDCFKSHLEVLEKNECIVYESQDVDYTSTNGWILTPKGIEESQKNRVHFKNLTINFNVSLI